MARALRLLVALPLGRARVVVDRSGMGLGERGGFEAAWAGADGGADGAPLAPEALRALVKEHLAETYREREGGAPPTVTLNLASHQLVDDLLGWSRLNEGGRPR